MPVARHLTSPSTVLAGLAAAAAACSQPAEPADGLPNVVVVCIDTVRADHTSLYGYERPTTPNLERIAAEGLVLGRHFANAPWTKPSVASIITGLHPSAHGSRVGQFTEAEDQFVEVLSDENLTMAEVFQAAGYLTLAHVTNYNMLGRFGYDQGYDEYRFVEEATGDTKVNAADRAAVKFALEALEAEEGPVFAWVHMMSVHQYIAPPRYQRFHAPEGELTRIDEDAIAYGRVQEYDTVEGAVADYDNAILFTDALVGRLFDTIREEHPNTILLVTSDHGEEFYDHGGFEHASTLYNEMLLVPAVLWGPGVPTGRIEGITDSIDLLPTLVELATGRPAEGPFPGVSVLDGGAPGNGKPATFAEQHHRSPYQRYSIVEDGAKLIRNERKRTGVVTYQLFRDAFAIEGKAAGPRKAPELRERLSEVIDLMRRAAEAHHAEHVGDTETEALSPEDLAELKALGYVE